MADVIDLRPACMQVFRLVAQAERLDAPTPCAGWTVQDLMDHLIVVAEGSFALALRRPEGVAAAATGVSTRFFAAADPEGPVGRVELCRAMSALHDAWSAPAAWDGSGFVPGSELSHETWGKIAFTEVVVHGWDLAVATGNGFSLPDETLEACWGHVSTFLPTAPVPQLWGPPVAVPDDAPLIDRIVALTGRAPVDLPPPRFD